MTQHHRQVRLFLPCLYICCAVWGCSSFSVIPSYECRNRSRHIRLSLSLSFWLCICLSLSSSPVFRRHITRVAEIESVYTPVNIPQVCIWGMALSVWDQSNTGPEVESQQAVRVCGNVIVGWTKLNEPWYMNIERRGMMIGRGNRRAGRWTSHTASRTSGPTQWEAACNRETHNNCVWTLIVPLLPVVLRFQFRFLVTRGTFPERRVPCVFWVAWDKLQGGIVK